MPIATAPSRHAFRLPTNVGGASDRLADNGNWPYGWVASAAGAILAMSRWQRDPDVPLLAAAAVGTLGMLVFHRTLRRPRGWAVGAVLMLAVSINFGRQELVDIRRAALDWERWSAAERIARGDRVAAKVADVATALQLSAARVVADTALTNALTTSGPDAVQLQAPVLDDDVESAMLVFRNGVLIGWAGQLHLPVSADGVIGTRLEEGAFHTALVTRLPSRTGEIRAVAVALLASAPPADRFARSLTQSLAGAIDIARIVIESPDSTRVVAGSTVIVVPDGERRLARVRALAYSPEETRESMLQRARARTGVPLAVAVLLVLVTSWRRPAGIGQRVCTAAALLAAVAVAPLNALSNVSPLFNAASYFVPRGGRLTGNIAALLITSALMLAVVFLVERATRSRRSWWRWLGAPLVLLLSSLLPFVLRVLARGIALPPEGAGFPLWIAWELAIALTATSVLLAGIAAGQLVLGERHGLHASVAPAIAIAAAVSAPFLWRAPGVWPAWYPLLWMVATLALALSRRGAALVVGSALVAGTGAATLTWGATVRARMDLAQHDLTRITAVDENAFMLLGRLVDVLTTETGLPGSNATLLRRYAASDLARAGYAARIARWIPSQPATPESDFSKAVVNDTVGAQARIAATARDSRTVRIDTVADGATSILVAAIPYQDGSVTTVAVPPRTRLLPADPFASLTGVASAARAEPPYSLTLAVVGASSTGQASLQWRRMGSAMHGDGVVGTGERARQAHVEVEMRGADVLVPRGALLALLDVAVVMLLWGASAMADGGVARWLRMRRTRWSRSYRVRLSATLLAFFIAPAAIFATWSWYRVRDDDRAARELLVREALRVAAIDATSADARLLASVSSSAGAPLFLFRHGQLAFASDSLLDALAPLGRLLPVSLDADESDADDLLATRRLAVGGRETLVGYRRLTPLAAQAVLSAPARGDEFALDVRREDLGVLLLFVTALGALAAVWSSGVAARALARPVGALREAALAIASGQQDPSLGVAPAAEFAPVYRAFGVMAEDLSSSRSALEAAQQRTEAVLQHVASGVMAMRPNGDVLIANPRADAMLAVSLRDTHATLASLPSRLAALTERCTRFLASTRDEEAFELSVSGRQLRARLTRLPSGAVLTLDDVTELASAQRVLAWGEMARQVAHEIKNPLTPIRLGVQHLRRAFNDGRSDFGNILDTNVTRVLSEIDHLDEIARAFSRYGMAPKDRDPGVRVDVRAVVADLLALERMGEDDVVWTYDDGADAARAYAFAQQDELKEVLLNLLENARLAQAHEVIVLVQREADHVVIEVRDNGGGIPADVLPRVFEPHFSTRTSGSGLGLAISRRLIEGWGGTIAIRSTERVGTDVRIALRAADYP